MAVVDCEPLPTQSNMGQKIKHPEMGAALLLICMTAPIMATQVVKSETWINNAGGGATGTFTDYQYDGKGWLSQKVVYNSLNNSGTLSSRTEYAYDNLQKLTSEKVTLPNASGTTTEYVYSPAGKLAVMIGKADNGLEKFRDSLFYGSDGLLKEQLSFKGGIIVFMHRFGLGDAGKTVSDTSFEFDGSDFVATQAVVLANDESGKPILETRSRKVGGSWFVTQTKIMEYLQGNLVSLREYEGAGAPANLLSTLTCRYDDQGKKIKEEMSDRTGKVLSTTNFDWWEVSVTAIKPLAKDTPRAPLIRIQGPYLMASGNSLRLIDLRGRLLYPARDIGRGQPIQLSSPSILIIPKSGGSPLPTKGR